MSGWRLRRSRPEDAAALHAVWRASVEATHDFLEAADLETISDEVRDRYLPSADLLLAVDAQDRPVGFADLCDGEIAALFIAPDWRGRGLGRAFVEAAGPDALTVSVNAQNAQAIGFYEAMGFAGYDWHERDDEGRPYPVVRMRRGTA